MSKEDGLGRSTQRQTEIARTIGTVTLTEVDYAALLALVNPSDATNRGRRQGVLWDFIFNVGQKGEIFSYTGSGHTRPEDRIDLQGTLPILDRISREAVAGRGAPGRFFGNRIGIYYKNRESELVPCVKITIQKPPRRLG